MGIEIICALTVLVTVICGVDEAGKGSVLGPLVIAGVNCESASVFSDLNVRDSKLVSPKERERLFSLIKKRCRVSTISIEAHEIDAVRTEMTMNACVARAHAGVISKLVPDTAYVDACDVNAFRYAEMVKCHLKKPCEIVSEHHADQTYAVVSAASIIAKVTRDRAIEKLSKEFGAIGSGYPSDPVTIAFLSNYIDEHRAPPACARASWRTVIDMIGKKEQSSLLQFL